MSDGYSLRYTVPHTVTQMSPSKAVMEAAGPPEPVWVPDPRPSLPELAEDFEAAPFTPEQVAAEYTSLSEQRPEEPSHDWVSIEEKIGSAKMEELLALFGGYPVDL